MWTPDFNTLAEAVRKGLVSEDLVTQAAERLYKARFQLGLFDPQGSNSLDEIPFSDAASAANRSISRRRRTTAGYKGQVRSLHRNRLRTPSQIAVQESRADTPVCPLRVTAISIASGCIPGCYPIAEGSNAFRYSVITRSAHSTSDTKIVGLPNFAPQGSKSV